MHPTLIRIQTRNRSVAVTATGEEELMVDSRERPLQTVPSSSSQSVCECTLSISIHADLHLPLPPEPTSESDITREGTVPSTVLSPFCVDDVIIVIQEVGNPSSQLLRFELGKDIPLPLARRTFRLTFDAMNIEGVAEKLFWLRVFSKSSMCIHLSCDHSMVVGPAEEILATSAKSNGDVGADTDNSSTTPRIIEGETAGVRQGFEQLLFRSPITLSQVSSLDSTGEPTSEKTSVTPTTSSVVAFLHIPDRTVHQYISLVLVDGFSGASRVLGRIDGNIFEVFLLKN